MSKKDKKQKDKRKSGKQFKLTPNNIARVVWLVCVLVLISAMVIGTIFTAILLLMPQPSATQQLDPETIKYIQQQLQNQSVTLTPLST